MLATGRVEAIACRGNQVQSVGSAAKKENRQERRALLAVLGVEKLRVEPQRRGDRSDRALAANIEKRTAGQAHWKSPEASIKARASRAVDR